MVKRLWPTPGEQRRRREAAELNTAAAEGEAAKAATQFVAEYPCDRYCRVEVDLDGFHSRFTLNRMYQIADREHRLRHAPRPPGRQPTWQAVPGPPKP